MKILLVNQGHTDNLGDKAILMVMKCLLKREGKNNIVTAPFIAYEKEKDIVCNDVDNSIDLDYFLKRTLRQRINTMLDKCLPKSIVYIIKEKKAIKNFLDKQEQIDAVIIGGGELLKCHHPFTYAFLVWVFSLKKRYDCPIAIWGVSSDEHFSALDIVIYKYVLRNCVYIGVRDNHTKEILRKQFQIEAPYAPDIVFEYRRFFVSEREVIKNSVLCFVNSFDEVNTAYCNRCEYYDSIYRKIPVNISRISIGYATQSDYYEALEFFEYLKKCGSDSFTVSLVKTDTVKSLVDTIIRTEILISGRMHPMILGLQYGKKIIPIPVKKKLEIFEKEWKDKEVREDIWSSIDGQFSLMMCELSGKS